MTKTIPGGMKHSFFTYALVVCAASYSYAQVRQQTKPILPPIIDPYSAWVEVKAGNGGFTGLFPSQPKYSKSYQEHVVTRDFAGALSTNEGINYEVVYLGLDYVTLLTASQFLNGTLKDTPESKVITSVPISV